MRFPLKMSWAGEKPKPEQENDLRLQGMLLPFMTYSLTAIKKPLDSAAGVTFFIQTESERGAENIGTRQS